MQYKDRCIIPLLIGIQVRECSLGHKYHRCLHDTIGRCTHDFSSTAGV